MNSVIPRTTQEKAPRTLHLTLKKKGFDMIAAGQKWEEYREIKPYWIARIRYKNITRVIFKNGYAKGAPTLDCEISGVEERTGREEWGADPGVKCFVLKISAVTS